MPEVVSQYVPLDPWFKLEQLSLGDWLPVPNFKTYSETDAIAEAVKLTRVQNTSYRVVQTNGTTNTPVGAQYDPPTSWYTVEKEQSANNWSAVNNPDISGSQKFYSLEDAQALAQKIARDEQKRTRVQSS